MPKIMTGVLFKTMTHRLDDIPSAEMTERFGQKYSPNACLICHTDKDIAWLKPELGKWPNRKGGQAGVVIAGGGRAVGSRRKAEGSRRLAEKPSARISAGWRRLPTFAVCDPEGTCTLPHSESQTLQIMSAPAGVSCRTGLALRQPASALTAPLS
jgi:hypothetical protein